MPSLPARGCANPGCKNKAARGSLCEACLRERQAARGSTEQRGYGDKHRRRLRILAFERDHWRCVDCGWRPQLVVDCEAYGLDEPSTAVILESLRLAYHRGERHLQADHIIPVETRPDLALELDNYSTLCDACHRIKGKRDGGLNANRESEPESGPRVR